MAAFLNESRDNFGYTIQLAVSEELPWCWRAAWLIDASIQKNDARIRPFLLNILRAIPDKDDGHQRELLKILLKMDLEEEFEGLLFDLSVNLWEQVRKQPSVRYYAFQGMVKVAEKYPELKNEVLSLTQPHYINPLSSGIRKSLLKKLNALED